MAAVVSSQHSNVGETDLSVFTEVCVCHGHATADAHITFFMSSILIFVFSSVFISLESF